MRQNTRTSSIKKAAKPRTAKRSTLPPPPSRTKVSHPDKIVVYGTHAASSAISRAPDLVVAISIVEEKLKDFRQKNSSFFSKTRLPLHPVRHSDLDKYTGDAVHQGVAVTLSSFPYTDLDSVIKPKTKKDILILLDGIQDPHNVGAIARSALAFGARGILIPEHNQAPVTSSSVKASVGAIFEIPIVRIGNINQMVTKLKENGWWIGGLSMEGTTITEYKHDAPLVLVIGNEGDGISHAVTEKCDFMFSIPINKNLESLNASVAAAIAMWEVSK